MTQREKDKNTREAVVNEIREIEEEFAKLITEHIGTNLDLNTGYMHRRVGALKALKAVLWT